ncbi:MAG: hypothetical protein NT062_25805, partial [Proteobacteria bacterium]|nr:hypothetical protein [Pseudomonadota bacterium]
MTAETEPTIGRREREGVALVTVAARGGAVVDGALRVVAALGARDGELRRRELGVRRVAADARAGRVPRARGDRAVTRDAAIGGQRRRDVRVVAARAREVDRRREHRLVAVAGGA